MVDVIDTGGCWSCFVGRMFLCNLAGGLEFGRIVDFFPIGMMIQSDELHHFSGGGEKPPTR